MRVLVKNLPTSITSDQLKREFQRAGKCAVELNVGPTQGTFAYVDFLDIVNASEAIKLFHGKDFAGNKISVTKEYDCVVNLSQKRGRENSQAANPATAGKVISLSGEKKNEINLNGFVYFGGKRSEDNGKIHIGNGNSGVICLPGKVGEAVKARKVEVIQVSPQEEVKVVEEVKIVAKPEESKEKVEEKKVRTVETKVNAVEKVVKTDEKTQNTIEKVVYNTEKVVKNSEKVVNTSEKSKIELESSKKDIKVTEKPLDTHSATANSLTIEIDGNKFLKTDDESKLHCILCNKEITKKSVKTHLTSKSHKSLL